MSDPIDNRYTPASLLGEGAMGQVWQARDPIAGRDVALKVVSNRLGASDKSHLQFKQEFRLMTQLRHPNCCQVYDYGETADGSPYFTMELVEGQGLDELLPLDEATFRRLFAQLMLALGYVHGLGLVHGDLKSANVRVKPDGTVKLMDYGLMDFAGRAGPIRGTPAYMAPEVIKRWPVDRRSDLYSAGCLAYELLTGVLPFGGTRETLTTTQLLRQHVGEAPLPLEAYRPGLAPELSALVLKLLAKDPLDRCQSAAEVLMGLGAEVPVGIGGTLLGSPLIGRREALNGLLGAIARLADREGGAVLVLGPGGIGKSRLLEEFRFAAQLEGLPCPSGECFEQSTPPYGPFLSVLKALAPLFDPELLAQHGPVLVKLLPELGYAPAPDLENPKSEMLRMQGAITTLLLTLAATRPFALALENWQWADPLSADLLDYVLRNRGDAAIAVAVTAREAPDAGRAIAAAPRVMLEGLAGVDLRRMVTSMLGTSQVDEGFLARLSEFSEGNPFMVERLLEHLVQTGVLANEGGSWNTATALSGYVLPPSLHKVLLGKFYALEPDARALASLGAVLGRQFELALAAGLLAFPDDRLFDALDQLQASQMLLHGEDGTLSFAQDQIPEVLYANLDPAERTALHGRVARALEARLTRPLPETPLDTVMALARHALAGGLDTEPTLRYALEAGERNRRLFAMSEAESFLAAGLALLDATERFPALRFGFQAGMGELKRQTSRAAEGRPWLERALPLGESLGVTPLGRLIGSLGKTQQMLQDFDAALATFERSVSVCLAEGDATGASRAYLASARVKLFRGDSKEALAHAEEGLRLAREGGDPAQRGMAHALIGYLAVASAPDRLEEGARHLQESLSLLGHTGDPVALSTSYQLLGNAQLVLGDYQAARGSFDENRRIAERVNSREEEAFACINLAIADIELANFPEALARARDAAEKARKLDARFPLGIALVVEAEIRAYLGEDQAARKLAEESLAIARAIKHTYLEGLVLEHQAKLLGFLGHVDEARAALTAREALPNGDEPALVALAAELARRAGDARLAGELAERALAAAKATGAKGLEARAEAVLAGVAMATGRFMDALDRSAQAIEVASRIGTRWLLAELWGLHGEASLALGNSAGPSFEAMTALANDLGAAPLAAMAAFGRAAAKPYEGGQDLASRAREQLEGWLAKLGPGGREAFTRYPERQRVLDGNYIGFSLPLRTRAVGRGTQPLVLPPGLRGTGDL